MTAAGTAHWPQVNIVAVHGDHYVLKDSLQGEGVTVLATVQRVYVVSVIFHRLGQLRQPPKLHVQHRHETEMGGR